MPLVLRAERSVVIPVSCGREFHKVGSAPGKVLSWACKPPLICPSFHGSSGTFLAWEVKAVEGESFSYVARYSPTEDLENQGRDF